ncbi:hypothetical protein GQ457_13G015160 [Hibiscus cannabinus]
MAHMGNNGQNPIEEQDPSRQNPPTPAGGVIIPPIPQNNQQQTFRTVRDYLAEDLEGLKPVVTISKFEAEHFELKLVTFNMMNTIGQFSGSPAEKAHQHLKSFLEICNSFKIHGVSNDFFFSITSFRQEDDEAIHEAWEGYRDLFRRCPMHRLSDWTQVSIFYNSFNTPTRMILDASANSTLLDKPPREGLEILEKLAQNDYQHPTTCPRIQLLRRRIQQNRYVKYIQPNVDNMENNGLELIIVYKRLYDLGWLQFGRQPARAKLNWVTKFYAHNAEGDYTVHMRGMKVPAKSVTINNLLGLPNNNPSIYKLIDILEDEDFNTIKVQLCNPDTKWNTKGKNPRTISRSSLQPEAKLWNTFMKRNLMSTSHNQTVDRTRLVLINAIITGYKFNVREVIAKDLSEACQNEKGILAFPCIITALCRRAAVPAYPIDKYTPEKSGWTRKEYMRKMEIVDATPIQMAMPTPTTSATQHSLAATPTNSPAQTPAAPPEQHDSRMATHDSPLGAAASSSTPSPTQPEKLTPLHILQLRNQL